MITKEFLKITPESGTVYSRYIEIHVTDLNCSLYPKFNKLMFNDTLIYCYFSITDCSM